MDNVHGIFVSLKAMKYLFVIGCICLMVIGCNATKETVTIGDSEKELFNKKGNDTIHIADEEAEDEYEIIIIEPGFNFWVQSIARPRGYYTQSFLETRNRIWVINWNQRVMQPDRFNPNLYELQINYDQFTDYGYEVNYLLFNYFVYFQRKYSQRLGPFVPRI